MAPKMNMYSPSAADFEDAKSFSSATTRPIRNSRSNGSMGSSSSSATPSHKRNHSSSSILSYLSAQLTPPASPATTPTRRPPATTPPKRNYKNNHQNEYPKSEQRLLQAHALSRALFACTPCQSSATDSANLTARPASYYLPSDIFDEDDVYEYCGVETVAAGGVVSSLEGPRGEATTSSIEVVAPTEQRDYVATLNQDYEMTRV